MQIMHYFNNKPYINQHTNQSSQVIKLYFIPAVKNLHNQ